MSYKQWRNVRVAAHKYHKIQNSKNNQAQQTATHKFCHTAQTLVLVVITLLCSSVAIILALRKSIYSIQACQPFIMYACAHAHSYKLYCEIPAIRRCLGNTISPHRRSSPLLRDIRLVGAIIGGTVHRARACYCTLAFT